MNSHDNCQFSTYDVDNDVGPNCSAQYRGAWWYKACHASNLNGYYHGGEHGTYADGVNWKAFRGFHYSLKSTRMMVRPRSFSP